MHTFSETMKKDIIPALKKQLQCANDHQVPTLVKVVLNVGVGRSLKDPNFLAYKDKRPKTGSHAGKKIHCRVQNQTGHGRGIFRNASEKKND